MSEKSYQEEKWDELSAAILAARKRFEDDAREGLIFGYPASLFKRNTEVIHGTSFTIDPAKPPTNNESPPE